MRKIVWNKCDKDKWLKQLPEDLKKLKDLGFYWNEFYSYIRSDIEKVVSKQKDSFTHKIVLYVSKGSNILGLYEPDRYFLVVYTKDFIKINYLADYDYAWQLRRNYRQFKYMLEKFEKGYNK